VRTKLGIIPVTTYALKEGKMFQATRYCSWFVHDAARLKKSINFCGTGLEAIAFGKKQGMVSPVVEPEFATSQQWEAYVRHLHWTSEKAVNMNAKLIEWLVENGINVYLEDAKVANGIAHS
jgi:hypothetical protein